MGLRSIEAARLQLDDLDWRAGRIVLQGKASREDGMPLPADVGEALSAYLRQARPATGEPPGVSAAVLIGVAVGVEPGRVRVGEQRRGPAAAVEPDQHPPVVADGGAQLGDQPGAARRPGKRPVRPSPLANGSPAASDTQVSTVTGAGTSTCLSVAADGTFVIRPPRAKLWAIIR